MPIRAMTGADAEKVSALIFRSHDRVLVHYHSPEMLARFREHATPESLIAQLGRKQVFVVDDAGRIVATGGLGCFDDPQIPREEQAGDYEAAADRRICNLFVAVDLIGRGIGRGLLTISLGWRRSRALSASTSPAAATPLASINTPASPSIPRRPRDPRDHLADHETRRRHLTAPSRPPILRQVSKFLWSTTSPGRHQETSHGGHGEGV